jgi:ATP/maltotriose-dependent transcriptional regulator MalT
MPGVMALKAKALQVQGHADQALTLLREASRLTETMQARMRQWPILLTLAEFEHRQGHAAQALDARVQARQMMEQIAAQSPAAMRGPFLAQLQRLDDIPLEPAVDA